MLATIGLLAAFSLAVNAIATISAVGSKFFDSDGNQFFIKEDDPLIDTDQCTLDANLMKTLGANAIRVYHVDATGDHSGCMAAFADAGIYLLVDLETFTTAIDPTVASWNSTQYNAYTKVMDAFHTYDNTLAFFIGNEVIALNNQSEAAPYIKAAARDLKAYRDSKGYRQIPVGYSAADISELRPQLQNYLTCGGNASESIDFYGLNAYEWCGNSDYTTSGYSTLNDYAQGFPVPIFFSETGCRTVKPRTFQDQSAIFGPDMDDIWSGAIIYEWIEETNDYGLISYGSPVSATVVADGVEGGFTRTGTPLPVTPDFANLQSAWSTLTPAGVASSAYSPDITTPACPASTSGGWLVDGDVKLPSLGQTQQTGTTTAAPTSTSTSTGSAASATSTKGAASGSMEIAGMSTGLILDMLSNFENGPYEDVDFIFDINNFSISNPGSVNSSSLQSFNIPPLPPSPSPSIDLFTCDPQQTLIPAINFGSLPPKETMPPRPKAPLSITIDQSFYPTRNTKTNMSTLQSSSNFPTPLPAPPNIPLRLPPHLPLLGTLDAACSPSHLDMLLGPGREPPQLEGPDAFEGRNREQESSRNALRKLECHIKNRTPYAQLASKRLQAAVGMSNDLAFELPSSPVRGLFPLSDQFGLRGVGTEGQMCSLRKAQELNRGPLGMQIDAKTGKGLREFLLLKGKEMGMRKKECRGISFHDFTPDMRTGGHRNVLLGHYGIRGGGLGSSRERIEWCEVDLYDCPLPIPPLTSRIQMKLMNPRPVLNSNASGQAFSTTERWIWFLISRPLISFDINDSSTNPLYNQEKLPGDSNESAPFYAFPQYSTSKAIPTPPPNFPRPIPASWLVFAAPLANTTVYPTTTDTSSPASSKPTAFQPHNKTAKRTDFDFSHSGTPLFEFGASDLFTCFESSDSPKFCDASSSFSLPFLSVENIGSWHENDAFEPLSAAEYETRYQDWRVFCEREEARAGRLDMPAPNRGVWWQSFYRRLQEDRRRWEEIRGAMGRGKCRVVVRWEEVEGERTALEGVMTPALGLGISGVTGGLGSAAAGRIEKKVGLRGLGSVTVGRLNSRRMTRSETRRKSVLGLGFEAAVESVGAGLADTPRAGVAGNRDLVTAAGAASAKTEKEQEREKGRGRKR
ncbi:hypothetical protein B7494_g5359 [Chlorociboria aeruginascens]|nr:hypothetical protein B7494_g5359 [Chlorociboria aeruginascens]